MSRINNRAKLGLVGILTGLSMMLSPTVKKAIDLNYGSLWEAYGVVLENKDDILYTPSEKRYGTMWVLEGFLLSMGAFAYTVSSTVSGTKKENKRGN